MIKGHWVKLTKEWLDFEKIGTVDVAFNDKNAIELLETLFWLFSIGIVHSDKGHFLIDKSIFITKDHVLRNHHCIENVIDGIRFLKKENMIIYENENEFFEFLRSCYEEDDL